MRLRAVWYRSLSTASAPDASSSSSSSSVTASKPRHSSESDPFEVCPPGAPYWEVLEAFTQYKILVRPFLFVLFRFCFVLFCFVRVRGEWRGEEVSTLCAFAENAKKGERLGFHWKVDRKRMAPYETKLTPAYVSGQGLGMGMGMGMGTQMRGIGAGGSHGQSGHVVVAHVGSMDAD